MNTPHLPFLPTSHSKTRFARAPMRPFPKSTAGRERNDTYSISRRSLRVTILWSIDLVATTTIVLLRTSMKNTIEMQRRDTNMPFLSPLQILNWKIVERRHVPAVVASKDWQMHQFRMRSRYLSLLNRIECCFRIWETSMRLNRHKVGTKCIRAAIL